MPETRIAFEKLLRSLGSRHLPIFVDSGGGSVDDAMAIGRLVRARRLDVVVTRTLPGPFNSSPTRDIRRVTGAAPARPLGLNAICASACTLILAAGTKRSAAPWTTVGVHQIVSTGTRIWKRKIYRVLTRTTGGVKVIVDRTEIGERTISSEHFSEAASKAVYRRVGAYLAYMGVKPSLVPMMVATPPSGLHRLTREEMISTALVTDSFDGNDLANATLERAPARGEQIARIATSLPEDATLADPGGDASHRTITHGRVTWTLDRRDPSSAAVDSAEHLALGATIDFPQVHLGIEIHLAPETYSRPNAPLVCDITFSVAKGSFQKVVQIMPLEARSDLPPRTTTLDGTVTSTTPTSFRLRLAPTTGGTASTTLIMNRRWIVVPLVVDGMRFLDVQLEHGLSSAPLLKRAFTAWSVSSVAPGADPARP